MCCLNCTKFASIIQSGIRVPCTFPPSFFLRISSFLLSLFSLFFSIIYFYLDALTKYVTAIRRCIVIVYATTKSPPSFSNSINQGNRKTGETTHWLAKTVSCRNAIRISHISAKCNCIDYPFNQLKLVKITGKQFTIYLFHHAFILN